MYIEDLINKLNKKIVRFNNVDYYPAMIVQDELRKKANECISWSEIDFEQQARQACDGSDTWDQYYNKDMFGQVLCDMIQNHDASIGITWDTIDYYLDVYCKIKEFKSPYS